MISLKTCVCTRSRGSKTSFKTGAVTLKATNESEAYTNNADRTTVLAVVHVMVRDQYRARFGEIWLLQADRGYQGGLQGLTVFDELWYMVAGVVLVNPWRQ